MSEAGQITSIEKYVNEIIAACKDDPALYEIAMVNFQYLINVMIKYEKAPKYFNSVLEDISAPGMVTQNTFQAPVEKKSEPEYPVMKDLANIYGRKLKQKDLRLLGAQLAAKTGLKLDRETKRSKVLLIQWFTQQWNMLHSKIYEFGLHQIDFDQSN